MTTDKSKKNETTIIIFALLLVMFVLSTIGSFAIGLTNSFAIVSLPVVVLLLAFSLLLKNYRSYYLLIVILIPLSNKISLNESLTLWGLLFPLLMLSFVIKRAYKKLPDINYFFAFLIYAVIITFLNDQYNTPMYGTSTSLDEKYSGFIQVCNLFLIILLTTNIKAIDKKFFDIILWTPLGFLPVIIYQVIFKPDWGGISSMGSWRIFGVSSQPNSFAIFMAFYIIVVMSFYFEFRKIKYLILSAAYFLMMILTFSRSGMGGAAFGIVILILLINYKFQVNIRMLVFGILFVILSLFVFDSYLAQTRLSRINVEDVESDRDYIWETIYPQIEGRELTGLGLGGYEIIRPWVFKELSPHSSYIYFMVNIGIIGILIALAILIHFILKLYQYIKTNPVDRFEKALARGSIAGLIVLISLSYVSAAAITPQIILFLGVSIARSLYFANQNSKKNISSSINKDKTI